MSDGIVFNNGEFVTPEDATMSIFDMGFVWGDCAYDVTSVWNGWFFMLEAHLDRFLNSCEGFRLESRYSRDDIRRICAECVERTGLDEAYVKLQMTRGVARHDPRAAECCFIAYAVPYVWIWGEEKCRHGANLYLSKTERVSSKAIDQRIKNYNRADLVQARFEAYDHGCDDALLCGPDGNLTEGPGYNVFLVRDGHVVSPDHNVLEGITRLGVGELCEAEGIPFELRKVAPDELEVADEIFASTTAGGVMPITQIDSKPVRNGHIGLVTNRIQELYWYRRAEGWNGTRVDEILSQNLSQPIPSAL